METVNVRYIVDDVDSALAFYTAQLGFALQTDGGPAFAAVTRGALRLSPQWPSEFRRPHAARRPPAGAGWLEPHRVRRRGPRRGDRPPEGGRLSFRSDVVIGPGGSQVVLDDPSGNPIELFE